MIAIQFKPTPASRYIARLALLARLRVAGMAVAYYTAKADQARTGTAWARARGQLDKYGAHFAEQAAEADDELRIAHAWQAVIQSDLARLQ